MNSPYHEFVVALCAQQLLVAEYHAPHDRLLSGEQTYWTNELRTRRWDNARLRRERDKRRPEEYEWINPDNVDGAVQLMEVAGFSEFAIDAYCRDYRDRLEGRKVTQELAVASNRYVGVYPMNGGNAWFWRVRSRANGIHAYAPGFATAEERRGRATRQLWRTAGSGRR